MIFTRIAPHMLLSFKERKTDIMNIKAQCWNLKRECINKLHQRKKIALTFDDGHKYADQILEKLEQHGVKSTFFLCGTYVVRNLDIYKKIFDAGHEFGNHSYNHPHMVELSEGEILSELNRTEQLLSQITGGEEGLKLFRFPYGSKNEGVIRLVESQGFIPVTWTVDSKDWTGISAEEICNNVLKSEHLEHGAIILMHTSGAHTVEALDLLIPELRKKGYEMMKISELFQEIPQYKKMVREIQEKGKNF